MSATRNIAMAIAAHPDDIEFYMAGTLLLLKQAGYETHYMTVASGSCGGAEHNARTLRAIRRKESQNAARLLGACCHDSLVDDLEVLYELRTLRRLAGVIRDVKPSIVLTHSPQDYMEDHTNTCRLAVTAAFSRGMPNFKTIPRRKPINGDVTLYHAMPHGLCDGMRQPIIPESFVNTTRVIAAKRQALAAHQSQKAWLDASQGMDSCLHAMEGMSRVVGKLSRRFTHAEGWRRHSHIGFCAPDSDPLRADLKKDFMLNEKFGTHLR